MTPGYQTAAEAGVIINRATATITKWCSQGLVPGAKKIKIGKSNTWVIPEASVKALSKKTPTREEARRLAGKKTADKLKQNQKRVKETETVSYLPYPPATPRQIEHDALMARIEDICRRNVASRPR